MEVERTRVEEGVEGAEGESKERGKSSEVYDVTSKSSMDEDRNGEN